MRRKVCILVSALVGFSFLAASMAMAAGKVLLRFKPSGKTRTYRVLRKDKHTSEAWDGKVKELFWELNKRVEEKIVRQRGSSNLKKLARQVKCVLKFDGVPVEKPKAQPTSEVIIDPLGNLVFPENDVHPEVTRTRLVFPSHRVGKGDTWTYTADETYRFPVRTTTKFRLVGFKKIRGRRCALIRSKTAYQGRHEDRNVDIELKIRGRIFFDIDEGCVVSIVSSTKLSTSWLKNLKDNSPKAETKIFDLKYRLLD